MLEDKDIFYEDYEPQVLPQPLCNSLSLPVQQEWWNSAYNLYTGKFRYLAFIVIELDCVLKVSMVDCQFVPSNHHLIDTQLTSRSTLDQHLDQQLVRRQLIFSQTGH